VPLTRAGIIDMTTEVTRSVDEQLAQAREQITNFRSLSRPVAASA
jgi:hypothetical protein